MSKVSGLYIHPVKSCKPIGLQDSLIERSGLKYDRMIVIADEQGHIITGRTHHDLLKMQCRFSEQHLNIDFEGQPSVTIDLKKLQGKKAQLTMFKTNIMSALELDKASCEWISACLGEPCKLFCLDKSEARLIKPKYGPQDGDYISFTDALPILLTNEESLDDLNGRLTNEIGMDRFRPNIVINGVEPFSEDQWKSIRIGECQFEVIKGCKRCVFTTVDPMTYTKDANSEPLKTLNTYRKREDGVYFGVYLIPRKLGVIHVGDPVEVLA